MITGRFLISTRITEKTTCRIINLIKWTPNLMFGCALLIYTGTMTTQLSLGSTSAIIMFLGTADAMPVRFTLAPTKIIQVIITVDPTAIEWFHAQLMQQIVLNIIYIRWHKKVI